ncbi:MAG: hypothetical protein K2K64_09655 [Muribaculaceae bacterium]|nr:hypothetical protein [Muribaculaceae bacterium]
MNGLVGSSFYDSLNKMVIGFLFILPLLLYFDELKGFMFDHALYTLLISWIVGIFLWAVGNMWLFPNLGKNFESNNLPLIKSEYKKICNNTFVSYPGITEDNLSINHYLKVYYRVQAKGLIGNIPILESISEFFKNFIFILIWWIILLFIKLILCLTKTETISFNFDNFCFIKAFTGILFCIVFIFMSSHARKFTEKKIYYLIFEADLLSQDKKTS